MVGATLRSNAKEDERTPVPGGREWPIVILAKNTLELRRGRHAKALRIDQPLPAPQHLCSPVIGYPALLEPARGARSVQFAKPQLGFAKRPARRTGRGLVGRSYSPVLRGRDQSRV